MRTLLALASALLSAFVLTPAAATAQTIGRPVVQVGMQPLPDPVPADIEAVLTDLWRPYYRSGGDAGFDPSHIRASRIDLNEDGRAELILMIDTPAWITPVGAPLLVATWTPRGWKTVGWGYGDPDGVFVVDERLKNWASIETRSYWLRWTGQAYHPEERPTP